jgi:flotillin
MDVTIKSIDLVQETIEKNQARYRVKSSTKYRISDVKTAADTYINDDVLKTMLEEIVKSGVRNVSVKYDLTEARSKKQDVEAAIRESIVDDLAAWGLELKNFQLVDFLDTPDSKIISNISKRSEVEIEARTREQNAEKLKQAKIKEAEADEKSKQREIERDRVVGEQEQLRDQKISTAKKVAEEKRFEVVQVQVIKQANIDKEKAEVVANQMKDVALIKANQDKLAEAINKEQKKLAGEGDKLKAEEIAKGEAAPIREKGNAEAEIIKSKGLAEAMAKDKLQDALNKFGDKAIQALVAEKVVAKDQAVGIATAGALKEADVKLFSGGGSSGQEGFDLGKMIAAAGVADDNTANALLNKTATPNDLGFTKGFSALGLAAASKAMDEERANAQRKETERKDSEHRAKLKQQRP